MNKLLTITLLCISSLSFNANAGRYVEEDYDYTPPPTWALVLGVGVLLAIHLNDKGRNTHNTTRQVKRSPEDIHAESYARKERLLYALRWDEYEDVYPRAAAAYVKCWDSLDRKSFSHAITHHFINFHRITDTDHLKELVGYEVARFGLNMKPSPVIGLRSQLRSQRKKAE